MLTNMDKLHEESHKRPVCVGTDTEISYLPTTDTAKTAGENVVAFNPCADRRHQGRRGLLQGADRLL